MPADRRHDLWFSAFLVVLSTGIVVESWRMPRLEHLGRTLVTLGVCLGYALGLVGRVPFWLATGLFVLAFVGWFGFERARPARSVAIAAATALVTSAAVTLLFERVFLVRLP